MKVNENQLRLALMPKQAGPWVTGLEDPCPGPDPA